MNIQEQARFKALYQQHLTALKLQGKALIIIKIEILFQRPAKRVARTSSSGDFQYRPGVAVYRARLYGRAEKARYPDKHGWQGAGHGQHYDREVVEICEIRGDLPEGLCQRAGTQTVAEKVFRFL